MRGDKKGIHRGRSYVTDSMVSCLYRCIHANHLYCIGSRQWQMRIMIVPVGIDMFILTITVIDQVIVTDIHIICALRIEIDAYMELN